MATIDCCTYDDVLRSPALDAIRTAATSDPSEDEFIQQAILAVSEIFESDTSRWFRLDTYVEVLSADEGQRVLQLKAYPLSSITSIIQAFDGAFASGDTLDPAAYTILHGGRTGMIGMRRGYGWLYPGQGTVQVTYVGGLANEVNLLPADLRMAAVEQAAFIVKRAKTAHLSGESVGGAAGGSVTYYRKGPLLESVEDVLRGYRMKS